MLIVRRGQMKGFIVFDFAHRYAEAHLELAAMVLDGRIAHHEHLVPGLEHAPDALNLLFTGRQSRQDARGGRRGRHAGLKSSGESHVGDEGAVVAAAVAGESAEASPTDRAPRGGRSGSAACAPATCAR